MTILEEEQVAVEEGMPEIQEPERSVLFMARRESLRLTMVPRHPQINSASGIRTGMTRGKSIGFRDGVLRIPLDDPDGKVRAEDTLDAGSWEEDTDVVLEWLRKHRLFGDLEEGFWEVPQTAPAVSDAELALLQKAAIHLDVDKLREFIDREERGWGREQLLTTARDSLEQVETVHAEARAQAERELAERQAAQALVDDEARVKAAEAAAATGPVVVAPEASAAGEQVPETPETTDPPAA